MDASGGGTDTTEELEVAASTSNEPLGSRGYGGLTVMSSSQSKAVPFPQSDPTNVRMPRHLHLASINDKLRPGLRSV